MWRGGSLQTTPVATPRSKPNAKARPRKLGSVGARRQLSDLPFTLLYRFRARRRSAQAGLQSSVYDAFVFLLSPSCLCIVRPRCFLLPLAVLRRDALENEGAGREKRRRTPCFRVVGTGLPSLVFAFSFRLLMRITVATKSSDTATKGDAKHVFPATLVHCDAMSGSIVQLVSPCLANGQFFTVTTLEM